jgi:DNA ligase (NAD+)
MPVEVFLKSLGIRNVGEHIAKIIAKEFITLEAVRKSTLEELTSIHEIGPEVANSIRSFFDSDFGNELIKSLIESGVNITDYVSVQSKSSIFSGKTLVVTGTLTNFSRKEIEDLIASLGGRASGSVSKNTDFVLAGEAAGSKLKKAEELGVKVLSEDEFITMSEIKNENH